MNFQAKLGTFLDLLWNLIGVKPKNNSFAMEKALGRGTPKRIAVVTGANKGIGLEICRQLSSNGVQVLLTARDEERGTAAVEKLRASGASDVVFHQLDVTDSVNASSLADFVRNQFGRLDILGLFFLSLYCDTFLQVEWNYLTFFRQRKEEEKGTISSDHAIANQACLSITRAFYSTISTDSCIRLG
ncbi:dehydrogenase/reductase SDR family member 13-like isoform X1 [Phoenix dactylifera]|uniref:Dehydrogenase/reductase SDR family member 13-like isoform X1 n=1 Tax=Phoenix dactylifera TaxID=42345 RepID=A0A8B9A864_PHODC|nr:dehydrogenase/reductase SDR family member 13-like isoform X1 [Phoenix dactylifera]